MRRSPVAPGYVRGLLTVIRKVPTRNEHGHTRWKVRCACGFIFETWGYSLVKKTGGSYSCGKGVCRTKGVALRRAAEDPNCICDGQTQCFRHSATGAS